ncbi:MAG: hypothetical protein AAFY63_10865 [Cyanobacteria bacterium J06643_13]
MANTSIHLPDEISARLKKYSDKIGKAQSTNKIIVNAIEEYLDRYEGKYEWSDRFLSWSGGEEEADALELDRSVWREIEL